MTTTFRSRQRASQRRDIPHRRFCQPSASVVAPTITSASMGDILSLFAPCPRGLETPLAAELNELGAINIYRSEGGVAFQGDNLLMMRANLMCRTASRILLEVKTGRYRSERDINALALQVDWPALFCVNRTFKVKTEAVGAQLKSLDYISLIVKDAICDRFRASQLSRPNIDTSHPDIRIQVFLTHDTAILYLDTSGSALFKRGWHQHRGEAPLRENLAAGILMLAGYTGVQPLIDPMCGSGTILIEAADIALKRAPGRLRSFAFQKLRFFDAPSWERIKAEAKQKELPAQTLPIYGSDKSAKMVHITAAALTRTGLAHTVEVHQRDIVDVRRCAPQGLIITNPPYGVRMPRQKTLLPPSSQLGDWLTQHFSGWHACFFTADQGFATHFPLAIQRCVPLFNGALKCQLLVVPVS